MYTFILGNGDDEEKRQKTSFKTSVWSLVSPSLVSVANLINPLYARKLQFAILLSRVTLPRVVIYNRRVFNKIGQSSNATI